MPIFHVQLKNFPHDHPGYLNIRAKGFVIDPDDYMFSPEEDGISASIPRENVLYMELLTMNDAQEKGLSDS